MPDSPQPSGHRRAWRVMSALGVILGSASLLLHAVGYNQRQDTAYSSEQAICAVIDYAEETLDSATSEQRQTNPEATERFAQLIKDMRATGVDCPPAKPVPLRER